MTAGDRPHLPLSSEPLPFLRARIIGRPAPGPVQPVEHRLALEEEPAPRVHLTVLAVDRDGTVPGAPAAPDAPAVTDRGALPATGATLPLPLAVGAIGFAWILRQRRGPVG